MQDKDHDDHDPDHDGDHHDANHDDGDHDDGPVEVDVSPLVSGGPGREPRPLT